jgi:predicted DNA binding CopG/RHH family protein
MYIIYIKYHQVEIIFYILRCIMQVKLDNYEKDIDDNFFKQESITNSRIQIDSFKQSAIKHLKTKRPVTIRIANNDLEAIKIKASKSGVAYQTYINMIIHKEAIKSL